MNDAFQESTVTATSQCLKSQKHVRREFTRTCRETTAERNAAKQVIALNSGAAAASVPLSHDDVTSALLMLNSAAQALSTAAPGDKARLYEQLVGRRGSFRR